MKKAFLISAIVLFLSAALQAQTGAAAGNWKTWFITSGKAHRLPAPASYKKELGEVTARQQELDAAGRQQIIYWNTGAPGYRWQEMIFGLWTVDTGAYGALANLLLGVATYDATIAAWNTKFAYNRPRPFAADNKIKLYAVRPESPSYPCEYSVAAGVAVTVISHFYPSMADSVTHMARRLMASRVAAGVAFPGDTRAGFALGKSIAEQEIEHTKNFVTKTAWDGKIPEGPAFWKGKKPMLPMAGANKTVVLEAGKQFRPGPPPDFAKDMAELKSFKRTVRSSANAYNYASGFGDDVLHKKILEYNLHLDPPMAARLYAIASVGMYDGFIACWDAKYAYWGIRPNQYDTTYQPLLFTPPFPGYPSGHAALGAVMADLCSYFFPADSAYFQKRALDGAESRFQAGIHFRTDNEVALQLGRKVATAIIEKVKTDGADESSTAEGFNNR